MAQTPDNAKYNMRRRDNKECPIPEAWRHDGGLYFVSNNQILPHEATKTLGRSPVHVRREVKIGLAGASETMHKRLNSYLLYWPMVVVYGVLFVESAPLRAQQAWRAVQQRIQTWFPNMRTAKQVRFAHGTGSVRPQLF